MTRSGSHQHVYFLERARSLSGQFYARHELETILEIQAAFTGTLNPIGGLSDHYPVMSSVTSYPLRAVIQQYYSRAK
jgi:hypothetical protein